MRFAHVQGVAALRLRQHEEALANHAEQRRARETLEERVAVGRSCAKQDLADGPRRERGQRLRF